MKKMLRLCLLIVSISVILQTISAENSMVISNGTDSFAITDSEFFNLRYNGLRQGFEVFFQVTNSFIDKVFIPKITKENLEELLEYINIESLFGINATNDYGNIQKSKILYLPSQLYPSLFYFTIGITVLALLIPIIGFVFCSYRCCCKKIDAYDRKRDSCKRKFYALCLFVLLTIMLIATIILFFTNMNSSYAVRQMQPAFSRINSDLTLFNENEMPVFYESVKNNLKIKKDETDMLLDTLSNKYLDKYFYLFNNSKLVEELKSEIQNITKMANIYGIETNNQDLVASIESSLDINKQINKFKDDLKSQFQNADVDPSKFTASVEQTVQSVKGHVDMGMNYLNNTIEPKVTKYWNLFTKYYDYFYFCLMVICVFILFLFLIYSTGLAGICARRTQLRRKQCCHRGLLAKLMMSGVGFFVLFSWIILFFSVTLYIPGITLRQAVCKPIIEIENNQLVKELSSNATSIKFTKILRECDQFGRSDEMKQSVIFMLKNIISNEFIVSDILSFDVDKEIKVLFNDLITNLKTLNENVANIVIVDPKPILNEMRNEINLLIGRLENEMISGKESTEYKNLLATLNELQDEMIQDSLDQFVTILNKKTDKIIHEMPSCKVFSNSYKSIVNVGCHEYLDNFNTYWFVLIIIVVMNIVIAYFAVKQSDLFRKHFAYDEISDEMYNGSKDVDFYPRSKKYLSPTLKPRYPDSNSAIDAFEMDNFHRYNQNYNSQRQKSDKPRNSLPPQYYK